MDKFNEIMLNGARHFVPLITGDTIAKLETYYKFLLEQNNIMNLTALTDPVECANLHFLDSLALFLVNDFKNASIIDIGSGAGFPGMPIKIAEPSAKLTLLDATAKRIAFLTKLCEKLCDAETVCQHARAEDAACDTEQRESYDIALSRAVAKLNILCELCLPFLKCGGKFLAMKGVESNAEVKEAESAAKVLGGNILEPIEYIIPNTDITHRIVVIEKVTETPSGFPRRFSRIKNSPL